MKYWSDAIWFSKQFIKEHDSHFPVFFCLFKVSVVVSMKGAKTGERYQDDINLMHYFHINFFDENITFYKKSWQGFG